MNICKLTIFTIIFAMAFTLTSCTKDPETPVSVNREAFLGKWIVKPTTKLTYEVTISADPNSSGGVFISNFADVGSSSIPASAEVTGTSIVLDDPQVIGDNLTIKGSGNLSGTKIIWNYTIFDGADLTTVAETYTRQ
jgi:hypothetical protein